MHRSVPKPTGGRQNTNPREPEVFNAENAEDAERIKE
jgi:hypothetical protein